MRRIAVINQKGGVGKTTTSANLAAALAEQGRRVVVVDMDPQANLSLHLGVELGATKASIYPVLLARMGFGDAILPTRTENLFVVPSTIDLSGAELELAATFGRERVLRDCIDRWVANHRAAEGRDPADYVLFDCPPSLGLLSVNALAAATEVLITVQTEFMALMGMSKLVEVVDLIKRRLNPDLEVTGILPCLYDSRLRLAREVLGEIRSYFPGQVFRHSIRTNVKLAEAPSFGRTILEYAPDSNGALDYRRLALALIEQEPRDPNLAKLPAPKPLEALPKAAPATEGWDAPEVELPPAEPVAEPVAESVPESVAEPIAEQETLREVVLTPAAPPGVERTVAEIPVLGAASELRPAVEPAQPGPGSEPVLAAAPPPAPALAAVASMPVAAAGASADLAPRPMQAPPAHLPRPAARPVARPADGVDAELRALGADELPSLPPEAQEVSRRRRGWGGPV